MLAGDALDTPLAPASLTKLMTAYVLFEKIKAGALALDTPVTVSVRAANFRGSSMYLRPQQTVPAESLLQGLITVSANDAAVALTEHVAGTEEGFVELMNVKAAALNLTHTHFTNVTGLHHAEHLSSARDLTRLAAALLRDFPNEYARFRVRDFRFNGVQQFNRNMLLWRDGAVDGIKTGHTREAGYCLIGSAAKGGRRLIATVLGSQDEHTRLTANQKLLEYGFEQFEARKLFRAQAALQEVRVWLGKTKTLALGLPDDLALAAPRGAFERIAAHIEIHEKLFAPIEAGQIVGTLRVMLDGNAFTERPVVALNAVEEGNLLERLLDRLNLVWN